MKVPDSSFHRLAIRGASSMLHQSDTRPSILGPTPVAGLLQPFLHLLLGALVCIAALLLGLFLSERLVAVPEAVRILLLVLAFYGPLLGAAVLFGRLEWLGERPSRSAGAAAGLAAMGFIASLGILGLAGMITSGGNQPTGLVAIPGMLLALLITAFEVTAEEAMFRGWLQRVLVRHWRVPIGLTVSAAAFTAIHLRPGCDRCE